MVFSSLCSLFPLFFMISFFVPPSLSVPRYNPLMSLLSKYSEINLEDYPAFYLQNSKRNGGMPDECRGKYDTSMYTQLDNICEDCYNLYKEVSIHHACKADCFSSSSFKTCLQALLLDEGQYVGMAQIIGK